MLISLFFLIISIAGSVFAMFSFRFLLGLSVVIGIIPIALASPPPPISVNPSSSSDQQHPTPPPQQPPSPSPQLPTPPPPPPTQQVPSVNEAAWDGICALIRNPENPPHPLHPPSMPIVDENSRGGRQMYGLRYRVPIDTIDPETGTRREIFQEFHIHDGRFDPPIR
jgi:hypothetical protein